MSAFLPQASSAREPYPRPPRTRLSRAWRSGTPRSRLSRRCPDYRRPSPCPTSTAYFWTLATSRWSHRQPSCPSSCGSRRPSSRRTCTSGDCSKWVAAGYAIGSRVCYIIVFFFFWSSSSFPVQVLLSKSTKHCDNIIYHVFGNPAREWATHTLAELNIIYEYFGS